jgi:phosphoribosyl-ATP pyrophosphohydrolase
MFGHFAEGIREIRRNSSPAMNQEPILNRLQSVIAERRASKADGKKSYVASLLEKGVPKIGEKIMEEAGEVVEAAGEPGEAGREHLVKEVADLLFHTMVLLGHAEIDFAEIEAELARRFGIGGHEEKAARTGPKKPND